MYFLIFNKTRNPKKQIIYHKSDRRNGINSRSDLPHDRTYRTVYGGSLSFDTNFSVLVREHDVSCFS